MGRNPMAPFGNFLLTSSFILLTGCSNPLSIHSDFVPSGSLRLAQVTVMVERADIINSKDIYDAIIASGIRDTEVTDGSVVMARIFSCGGRGEELSAEKADAIMAYAPKRINVAIGDIMEVRVGRPPENGDSGLLNVVTRVVQKYGANEGKCWWDLNNDRFWLRILYCDWMAKEGWIKQGGISPAWYKPPALSRD